MPQGDKSKEECFRLWKNGKSIREIKRSTTAKYETIKMWFGSGRGVRKELGRSI
jgi:hypothetical protein